MPVTINYIGRANCTVTYDVRDNHGVLERFGVLREELLQLCGGIPNDQQSFANVDIESASEVTVRVIVDGDLYRVCRTINFKSRNIYNDKMLVYEKDKGVGTNLFLNQVAFAKQMGFARLKTIAVDYLGNEKADGYYRWARLGYQMTDRNDLEDFADMKTSLNRPEKTLGELVQSEEG